MMINILWLYKSAFFISHFLLLLHSIQVAAKHTKKQHNNSSKSIEKVFFVFFFFHCIKFNIFFTCVCFFVVGCWNVCCCCRIIFTETFLFCDIFSVLVQSVFNALLTDSARTKHLFLKPSFVISYSDNKVAIPPVVVDRKYKHNYIYMNITEKIIKVRKSGVDN